VFAVIKTCTSKLCGIARVVVTLTVTFLLPLLHNVGQTPGVRKDLRAPKDQLKAIIIVLGRPSRLRRGLEQVQGILNQSIVPTVAPTLQRNAEEDCLCRVSHKHHERRGDGQANDKRKEVNQDWVPHIVGTLGVAVYRDAGDDDVCEAHPKGGDARYAGELEDRVGAVKRVDKLALGLQDSHRVPS